MKSLANIIHNPKEQSSQNTVLSVAVTILNISNAEHVEIIRGMHFLGFLGALENILRNDETFLAVKSVALLAYSNLYTRLCLD